MMDRVGRQLGNYRLIQLLGEGGFAEVYLAEQVYLKTLAAIKVLHTRLAPEDRQSFLNEAQTIARLRHPQIVRVLDFGVEGGMPYLVMEYAPNGTLRQRYARGNRIRPATVLPYVRQVASALQYAHDRRLIHRDVKPENMLLGEANEVLLSDFGIAIAAQSSRYQNTEEVVGTLAYMAPEQAQGHPRPASDQYSLGVVVYEWLCGQRPFQGSLSEVVAMHLSAPPPSLRVRLPMLAPAVEDVVLKALEKDWRQRFASAQAFADAFERACQEQALFSATTRHTPPPVTGATPATMLPAARPVSEPSLPPPLLSPRRPPESAESSDARPQSSSTGTFKTRVAPASGSPKRPLPAPSLTPGPKQQLSRRKLLIAGSVAGLAVVGGGILLARSLLQPAATQSGSGNTFLIYRGHTKSVNAVAWSPDGARIASGSDDGQAQAWGAKTGTNVVTYRIHLSSVASVSWSPDTPRIVSGGVPDPAEVWDATTGDRLASYSGLSADSSGKTLVRAVAWSPDGKHIAASGGADPAVLLWSVDIGSTLWTVRSYVTGLSWSPNSQHLVVAMTGTAEIWDATTGKALLTYRGHSGLVNAVAWSPDGTRVASASSDGTAQVWNAGGGSAALAANLPSTGTTPTATPTPGSGSTNTPTPTPTVTLTPTPTNTPPSQPPTAPPRRPTATPTSGTTPGVTATPSGSTLLIYRGHAGAVNAVAWSPDSGRVASAGDDRTVQVWDAATGEMLFTYTGHTDVVHAVAWSPDGQRIASGSRDKTVQVWQVPG